MSQQLLGLDEMELREAVAPMRRKIASFGYSASDVS